MAGIPINTGGNAIADRFLFENSLKNARGEMGEVLDVEFLRECVSYDPISGILHWKNRPLSHFESQKSCDIWNKRFALRKAGSIDSKGYLVFVIKFSGRRFGQRAHRVAWALSKGYWPTEIDHINRDKSDNRIVNLREVSTQQNCMNRAVRAENTLGVKGVSKVKNRYRAKIKYGPSQIFIGSFLTLEEADAAYRKAASEIFGEYAIAV